MRIELKPLSVNEAWQGKRFKTKLYDAYILDMFIRLPKYYNIPKGKLKVNFIFGFSNKGADIDNPIKPILDILQKKYDFNDNQIYELNIKKEIVPKGKEFIDFEIGIIKQ